MVLGIVIIAMLAGFSAAGSVLYLGGPVILAFFVYSGAGAVTVLLLALALVLRAGTPDSQAATAIHDPAA